MIKGLCILNAYSILPGARNFYERMKTELSILGVSLSFTTNAEILCYVDKDKIISKTLDADFVLYLDKDLYISYALESCGFRLFNKARSIELCDDKMRTHLALANQGIAMPRTISGPLNYSSFTSDLFMKNVEALLSFPLIAKENFGSLGERVYLIENDKALRSFEDLHKHDPRLYQEFIQSSKGMDYRIIVIGGKVAAGMKRVNDKGDFRSNIALGGHGEKVEIPAAFLELAEKAAKALDLDYCGVDVLIGKQGEPLLCEVNSNAFIGSIEPTTGINVANIYARHIVSTLKARH